MAHQSHAIPRALLASNFTYIHAPPSFLNITNLYPRWRPQQGKDITYFIEAFVRNLDLHAGQARRKYDDTYVPADPEGVIITNEVAARIAPHVRRNGRVYKGRNEAETRRAGVSGLLPENMRTMRAFLIPYARSHCDYTSWEENNGKAYDAVEIMKTLLMAGEMDTIFRICAHPSNDYLRWWSVVDCSDGGGCTCNGRGWISIAKAALRSYICLNMLYCYPETWDAASGRSTENDYRHTACYQRTLIATCMHNPDSPRGNSVIPYLPHQEFFGIANDDTWCDRAARARLGSNFVNRFNGQPRPGSVKIDTFLDVKGEAAPLHTTTDVSDVLVMLRSKGLPAELVSNIMRLADYRPRRRTGVPQDPLHPQNYEELRKYLTYCWALLLRCDIFARELGAVVAWKLLVGTCVVELWGSTREGNGKGQMYTVPMRWGPDWVSPCPDDAINRLSDFDRVYRFI